MVDDMNKLKKNKAIVIRRFEVEDALPVSDLIAETLRTTNSKDYSPEYIEKLIRTMQAENIIERASWTHFYVACDGNTVIGCGAIGPYWGKADESSLFTIFVLPEYQGYGVGKQIIAALEQDEYYMGAKRIEVPASITAVEFYRKFGYDYKNGNNSIDEEGLYRLEKYNQ